MKLKIISLFVLGCLMFSENSFAEADLNKIISKKEDSQSSQIKSRRAKVQMCHECGKPETECECKGEEHGVKEGQHESHEGHDDH